MNKEVKGYKVFSSDWTCSPNKKPFQYEVGKIFEEDVELSVCGRGFHFCKRAQDCFRYYAFDRNNKVAEVAALGDVLEVGDKCCTNKIKILKELTWQEVLTLVNTGVDCTGFGNSGDRNSGDFNSGNFNSGNFNSGNRNSGSFNSGRYNSGNFNSGRYNSGDRNSGDFNSGSCNRGNRNSGDYNSGSFNSGRYNSGNRNSGDYNKTSFAVGCFNVEQHKLLFFDKPTDLTYGQWCRSEAKRLLDGMESAPVTLVDAIHMTDAEKAQHPKYETMDGCLRKNNTSNCFIEWWKNLSKREKNIIKEIPNFDAEKFFLITGIRTV